MSQVQAAKRRSRDAAKRKPRESVLVDVMKQRRNLAPIWEEADEMNKENALITPQKNFYFQQRHGRVDLRAISRVDLEAVIDDVDVQTLQMHLENITFGDLDQRDMESFSDENLLKLFKIAQLTIEYLLNVQHTLYNYSNSMEVRLDQVEKELVLAASKTDKQSQYIEIAKNELKQKKKTLRTYEFLLTQRPNAPTKDANPSTMNRDASLSRETMDTFRKDHAQQMEEQIESMRKMLLEESESLKKQLREEMEKKKNEYEERERELEERLTDMELTKQDQKKGRPRLAGMYLEDDDDMQTQVNDLLAPSNQTNKFQQELSAAMSDNDKLRLQVGQLMEREQILSMEKKHYVSIQEKQMEQTLNLKTDKIKEQTLMMQLAESKVSSDRADLQSLQLRRVLRLIRRRVQLQSFSHWRISIRDMIAEEKTRILEVQIQSMKDSNRIEIETQSITSISYEWQTLPASSRVSHLAEIRSRKSDTMQVRIPSVWPLDMLSNIGRVTVPVARKTTVRMVREAIASEFSKKMDTIVLIGSSRETISDELTVEAADFFNKNPTVKFESNTLTEIDVKQLMEQYAEEHPMDMKAMIYSPVPQLPQIRSRWFHEANEVETSRSEIQNELSMSLRSTHGFSDDEESMVSLKVPQGLRDSHDFKTSVKYSSADEEDILDDSEVIPYNGSQPSKLEATLKTEDSSLSNDSILTGTHDSLKNDTPFTPQRPSTAAVNFGDYDSSFVNSVEESSFEGSDLHDLEIQSQTSLSKAVVSQRHRIAMARFSRVGLTRRAHIETMSNDSGSSNTITSVSSEGDGGTPFSDSLGQTNNSHFDISKLADQYVIDEGLGNMLDELEDDDSD